MIARASLRALLLFCASASIGACAGDGEGRSDAEQTAANPAAVAATSGALAEMPWEVLSSKGETLLPDVFYADASQNEQVMPYAIDGHVQINRLVYPTLGNPNLYTKDDAADELVVVLRIEPEALAHLRPQIEPIAGSPLRRVELTETAAASLGVFLVARSARGTRTTAPWAIPADAGVFRLTPSELLLSPEPADMPAVLKRRQTARLVFKQDAMAAVPPGLYDVRFEVTKPGAPPIYEYQYNAVRVFSTEPDEYSVMNVTDTQVSVGAFYGARTRDKLEEFVSFVKTSDDPSVRGASFITFNGDLHNGGSPGSLRQRTVAWTYHDEAKATLELLKELPIPIFLTAGNHDGYASTGHVPAPIELANAALFDGLDLVVADAPNKAWPGFEWRTYADYLNRTAARDLFGGEHRDLFAGGFARGLGATYAHWHEVPRDTRNIVLYDGFYQWQKTYGPLYYSYRFGKNLYVSLNSFELRQHRRTGWGMYTVNYGGGVSDVQMSWLDRELARADVRGDDVVLLAHHDPRGGHKGTDFGYYFEQVDYRSIYQSVLGYVNHSVMDPALCALPEWALPAEQLDSCLHDGLQEWMRPDPEFDCADGERNADRTCRPGARSFASGIELLKRIAASPRVRTVLLGHTHYNSLEVLQQGDELLPDRLLETGLATRYYATLEVANPLRGYALQQASGRRADYDEKALAFSPIADRYHAFAADYERAIGGGASNATAMTAARELVVLRLVSNANITSQTYVDGRNAIGFSVLHLTKKDDPRHVDVAQINRATFFVNGGARRFDNVATIDLDRTQRLHPRDPGNPIDAIYDW